MKLQTRSTPRVRIVIAVACVAGMYLIWFSALHWWCGPEVVRIAARGHHEWLLVAARLGGADLDAPDGQYVPALHRSLLERDPEALRMLLRHGANPELHLEDSTVPPLVYAVEQCGLPCVRVLAEEGANLESGAVMAAEEQGRLDIVSYLVGLGAHRGPIPPEGLPPLRLRPR